MAHAHRELVEGLSILVSPGPGGWGSHFLELASFCFRETSGRSHTRCSSLRVSQVSSAHWSEPVPWPCPNTGGPGRQSHWVSSHRVVNNTDDCHRPAPVLRLQETPSSLAHPLLPPKPRNGHIMICLWSSRPGLLQAPWLHHRCEFQAFTSELLSMYSDLQELMHFLILEKVVYIYTHTHTCI